MQLAQLAVACLVVATLLLFPRSAAGWAAAAILMGLYSTSVHMRNEAKRDRATVLDKFRATVQLMETLVPATEEEEEGGEEEQKKERQWELPWLCGRITRAVRAFLRRVEAAERAAEASAASVRAKEQELARVSEALMAARQQQEQQQEQGAAETVRLREALVAAVQQVAAAEAALVEERAGWERIQQDLKGRVGALMQEVEGLRRMRFVLENRLREVTDQANAAVANQQRALDKRHDAAEREVLALQQRIGEQQEAHAAEQAALLQVLAQAEGSMAHQNQVVQHLKHRLALAEQQLRSQSPQQQQPQQHVHGRHEIPVMVAAPNNDALSNAAAALTAEAAAEKALGLPPGLGGVEESEEVNPSPKPAPGPHPQPEREKRGKGGQMTTTPPPPPPPVQQQAPGGAAVLLGAAATAAPAVASPGGSSVPGTATKAPPAAAAATKPTAAHTAPPQRRKGYRVVDMDV